MLGPQPLRGEAGEEIVPGLLDLAFEIAGDRPVRLDADLAGEHHAL
jgi:hypothetical protein